MPTFTKSAGAVRLPEGLKETGRRVDIRPDEFTLAIETKGYRVAWKRSAWCPCRSANTQSDQPDPTCSLCGGTGFIFFAPAAAVVNPDKLGALNDLQASLLVDAGGISAIMSSFSLTDIPYDKVRRHLEGSANISVRAENVLGYYDQIVNLDALTAYFELLEADGTSTTTFKYPTAGVNLLRSEITVFVEGTHFNLVVGVVNWTGGNAPSKGTTLSAHYLCHPTWRVVTNPHSLRNTIVKFKTTDPVGTPTPLPVQALVKLEWLIGD